MAPPVVFGGNSRPSFGRVELRGKALAVHQRQPTHASAIAVEEHVDVGGETGPVYKMGLSGKGVHREMAAYCFLLIRGLDQINDSCALGITTVTADLKSEYASVFRKTLDHGGN